MSTLQESKECNCVAWHLKALHSAACERVCCVQWIESTGCAVTSIISFMCYKDKIELHRISAQSQLRKE